MREKYKMIAKTFFGLEGVLAKELEQLGATEIKKVARGVEFTGDKELMYKVNYLSRTALRVMKFVDSFMAFDANQLYKEIQKIKWWKLIPVDGTFIIDAHCHNSELDHTRFVSLKSKDAIVDQFRKMFGKRPSISNEYPDLRIDIRINNNECIVSLDSSSDSLHKRNYRKATNVAPINEVLAAGLIQLSGWDQETTFFDPMCGSGTLLIEAAMLANNIPSGYYRKNWGFMKWHDFERTLWKRVVDTANKEMSETEALIIGRDKSEESIEIAMSNLKHTRLHHDVSIEQADFLEADPPEGKLFIVSNPPYDQRIKEDNIVEFYQSIGDSLKKKYTDCNAWLISSEIDALMQIGLKADPKIKIMNGPLECRFNHFELYKGSRKEEELEVQE